MSWPAVLNSKRRRIFALFALAEISLLIAIPFLSIAGFYTLLDSRSGVFVEQVGPDQPEWRALVEPSSIVAVLEQYDGELAGVTLIVSKPGVPGGTAVIIPASMSLDGQELAEIEPENITPRLSELLRLRIDSEITLDAETWPDLLGGWTAQVQNPDLVSADQITIPVGEAEVAGANAAIFAGHAAEGADSATLLSRRLNLWKALAEEPPNTDHPVAAKLNQLATGSADVFMFPSRESLDSDVGPDQVSELVRRAVPFPAGAKPDHRIRLKVVDKTGRADLPTLTSQLASLGYEVVEMGNDVVFDGGPTELVVPSQWIGPDVSPLADQLALTQTTENVDEPGAVATLFVGDDFDLQTV